ncbi:MAG: NusG domain II-containing protein, partial [Acidaminococcaceae bacterium]
ALGLALFNYFTPTAATYTLEIRNDREVLATIKSQDLPAGTHKDLVVPTTHGQIIVRLDATSGAAIISSPCPDQLCVQHGYVRKTGQAILCLPEKVLVTILTDNGKDGAPDALLR